MQLNTRTVLQGVSLVLIIVTVALMLFAPMFGIGLWNDILNNYLILQTLHIPQIIIILGYIVLAILFSKLIISVVKGVFKSIKLSKLSVKNAEFIINSDQDKDNSIFNRYLDEILYFFEVNPYQIVFIEDLDRFNGVKIFMKLRELNALINNSEQINRKVIFIYAIKDDMFMNTDRTKFFDFIIPVIPIINSTNSGELLWKELEEHKLNDGLTELFINDVCIFVDDMRILNNIFNEYIIYKKKLMSVENCFLNPINMFAMIVYKNIYPSDFAKLQFNYGFVNDFFEQKKKFIDNEIVQLKIENEKLFNQLNDADKEYLQSKKEIKSIYWNEAVGYRTAIIDIMINRQYYTFTQVLQDNFDISIIENNFHYRTFPSNEYTSASMDPEIRDALLKRIEIVKGKSDDFQKKTHERMEEIKYLVGHMKSWTLKTTIDEIGIDKFFSDRNSKNSLIEFLLRNGYINEMYPNYINYFYEGSLTYYDMIFIMKIKEHKALEFTHTLKNLDKIMMRLGKDEFERKEILNYDLLNHLIDNNIKYKDQIASVMKQLSDEGTVSILFIESFLENVKQKPKFIKELCRWWHNIWINIISNLSFSDNKKQEYLRLILLHADIEDIKVINNSNFAGENACNSLYINTCVA